EEEPESACDDPGHRGPRREAIVAPRLRRRARTRRLRFADFDLDPSVEAGAQILAEAVSRESFRLDVLAVLAARLETEDAVEHQLDVAEPTARQQEEFDLPLIGMETDRLQPRSRRQSAARARLREDLVTDPSRRTVRSDLPVHPDVPGKIFDRRPQDAAGDVRLPLGAVHAALLA